jgi:hypothetical protein
MTDAVGLGIMMQDLMPDLAQAMDLDDQQRGAVTGLDKFAARAKESGKRMLLNLVRDCPALLVLLQWQADTIG